MSDGQVIEFSHVTKRFGSLVAVSDFSAEVSPGLVTGFLGPNGAGKTTTLRMLLGLVRQNAGSLTIGGKRYAELRHPLHEVGAALEASSFHPGRSGANHLKVYARAAGISARRVDEVLALVGLSDAAGRRVGGYSLGMRQRLALATALLGDPGVLVLDEPANGLDPEGIKWMRTFLRQLAAEGRTVLISSHMLAEVQQTVDAIVIISHGRRMFQGPLWALSEDIDDTVIVDAPDRAALEQTLAAAGLEFEVLRSGLAVHGSAPTALGALAAGEGLALSALQKRVPPLEEIFLDLVNGTRTHPSAQGYVAPPAPPEPAPQVVERSDAADDAVAAEPEPEASDLPDDATPDAAEEATDVRTEAAEPAEEADAAPADGDAEPEPETEGEAPADDHTAPEEGEQR